MPPSDLRKRLQRLRLQKLKREIPPPRSASTRPHAYTSTPPYSSLPGREVLTPLGAYHLIENTYPLHFVHGPARLADMFARDPATAARLARDAALAEADLRSLALLDVETTGLVGGTGTLVFLVGVGVFEGHQFVLRQYFMRDPGEEPAMLDNLVADLAPRGGWVTFNGRAFDLPLLETRLTLNRQRGALGQRPHLDLLAPARRLYRGRLPSCSLGHIEQHVLKIIREQEDVPGELIPQMYLDYLRTGDPTDMRRVIYHNAVDILSMVTLAAHLLDVFSTPLGLERPPSQVPKASPKRQTRVRSAKRESEVETQKSGVHSQPSPTSSLQSQDLLRLARWHDDQGRPMEAEAAYRRALQGELSLADRRLGLAHLAALLKRHDRRIESLSLWEQLASFTLDDPEPFVELAKYYEWHAPDIPQATAWTKRALAVVASWPKGWQRDEATAELRHRLERLHAKA